MKEPAITGADLGQPEAPPRLALRRKIFTTDDNSGQLVLAFLSSIDRNIKRLDYYDSFLFYLLRSILF